MAELDDVQVAQIRELIHSLNNALNAMSMQAELLRLLAADSQSQDKISACVDTITRECKKGGEMAREVGSIVKKAAAS